MDGIRAIIKSSHCVIFVFTLLQQSDPWNGLRNAMPLNYVYVLDRQVLDRGGGLSHVQAFLHAVLLPSVRILVVHPQQTRSRTLTVAVTHPGTNAHNC